MRCSAVEILSSSPRDLGWMANEMAGSGKAIPDRTMGFASSQRVSPVSVSLSLATTPISPGPSASIVFCVLPCSQPMCPTRSLAPRVALSTWLSDRNGPEYTRNTESLPTCGSEMVLKTSAAKGALGSAARVAAALVFTSVPSTALTSAGGGGASPVGALRGGGPVGRGGG